LSQILGDLEDAYRWIRKEGPQLFRIDPGRVAVVGHSAGGYLALMAGFRPNPHPAAVVSFSGYGDVAAEWYSRPDAFYGRLPPVSKEDAVKAAWTQLLAEDFGTSRRQLYLYLRQQGLWPVEVVGHDPDKEPKAFDAFCPLRNVTKDYPPTLLIHGDQDTDVPIEQSSLMATEFERLGVPHEFIRMVGRGHGFDGPVSDPDIAAMFERVLGFLEQRLRP